MSSRNGTERRIGIIGTGFSGLCLGIQLKKTGRNDFVIFEKADAIGGTWRENTYPGAECDIPSALYSFSFERNPNWTHKWSEQPEILRYLEHCAKKYDLYPHIRFNQEVTRLTFDEANGEWLLETADGTVERFDAVVSAVGQLHRPRWPNIEGIDRYQGVSFHSAQWNHDYDLTGKRVCCIGNGASAIQFIPQIAPKVERLTIFQRTANWMVPKNDREYYAVEKWLGSVFPPFTNWYRFQIWFRGEGMLWPLMKATGDDNWLRKKSQQTTIDYINEKIGDPELREILAPDYPMGAKRILFSDDYYDALARDNVEVVTTSIDHIDETGVVTTDGTSYDCDALIYATGFETTSFLTPMQVYGRAGDCLNSKWERDGAEAYLGITHAGFPNFFMMYGPNTNLGHNSIVLMIEAQTRYILSCLDELDARNAQWLDVKADTQKSYNEEIQTRMQEMVWPHVEHSWYKRNGKVTNNWVGRTTEYRRRTKRVNPQDYAFS